MGAFLMSMTRGNRLMKSYKEFILERRRSKRSPLEINYDRALKQANLRINRSGLPENIQDILSSVVKLLELQFWRNQ